MKKVKKISTRAALMDLAAEECRRLGYESTGTVRVLAARLGCCRLTKHGAWEFLCNKFAVDVEKLHGWKIVAELSQPSTRRTRKEFDDFYISKEWRHVRYQAIKKHGRVCMCCGATDKPIHVDHVKPRFRFPELELELSNLQILCEDCNMGKGGWDETDWRSNSVAVL